MDNLYFLVLLIMFVYVTYFIIIIKSQTVLIDVNFSYAQTYVTVH